MRQTGRLRTPRCARGRRHGLAALVMLLVALGAGLLVSAGSPHHARPSASSPAAVMDMGDVGLVAPMSEHEHHHGFDWTPVPAKRLRPAATVTLLGIVATGPHQIGVAGYQTTTLAKPPVEDGFALLRVLRI